MTITDSQRHRLHTKLDEVLGEEDAAVLISHLPPSGWSDVVRTRDLDHLAAQLDERLSQIELRMDARFETTDARFETTDARFEASLERAMREQTNRFLAYVGVVVAVISAAGELIGRAVGG